MKIEQIFTSQSSRRFDLELVGCVLQTICVQKNVAQIFVVVRIFCQSENRLEGLGGTSCWTQRRVIAADRKYQAFNYQQCYHIIATNKSVTTEQR